MEILLVDDEVRAAQALEEYLQDEHSIGVCKNGKEALEYLSKHHVDLVITDHNMPEMTGIELIEKAKPIYPDCFFIMITAHSSVEHAIQALRTGADDYLMKPVDFSELSHRVLRVQQLLAWKGDRTLQALNRPALAKMIGTSPALEGVKTFAQKVSDVHTPVLITGPSGCGKELLARAIHELGLRKGDPFVAINCAALNEQLLESELFGHEKGAFTGASASKAGKFELARGGTLFLDEIGELAPSIQANLLRVLQEKEYYRVGGNRLLKANCRIVAATHRDLESMVSEGSFREDLFFRLNVLRVEIPGLHQRREDIPQLAQSFCQQIGAELGSPSQLSDELLTHLAEKNYVGNIRELKNEIERLMVLNRNVPLIDLVHLAPRVGQGNSEKQKSSSATQALDYSKGLSNILNDLEREIVSKALEDHQYNQVQTAKALGITRGALQYKLNKYDLALPKAV